MVHETKSTIYHSWLKPQLCNQCIWSLDVFCLK
nr:MAG TPA: hypothetical protein [Bacteriophage sp.]